MSRKVSAPRVGGAKSEQGELKPLKEVKAALEENEENGGIHV